MKRRLELEKIILGTLLNNCTVNFYPNARCCLTEDMFSVEQHKRIWRYIQEFNEKMGDFSFLDIYKEYKDYDLCTYMAGLLQYDFVVKKMNYNEGEWQKEIQGCVPKYTDVTFDDYITELIKRVYA